MNVPLLTTLSAAAAAVAAIQALKKNELHYRSLQSHFGNSLTTKVTKEHEGFNSPL
jgi:hypothetical protein